MNMQKKERSTQSNHEYSRFVYNMIKKKGFVFYDSVQNNDMITNETYDSKPQSQLH